MGLLRPATPLALIFFLAFVLLVLATLSTPVIHAIPLGSFQGVKMGVFGYCKPDGTCLKPQIGYSTGTRRHWLTSQTFEVFVLLISV
jgi:hypothetical protein